MPFITGISICVIIRVMVMMMLAGRGSLVGGKKIYQVSLDLRGSQDEGGRGKKSACLAWFHQNVTHVMLGCKRNQSNLNEGVRSKEKRPAADG